MKTITAYQCVNCGHIMYPHHYRCLNCNGREFEEIQPSGNAKLLTYTIVNELPWGIDERGRVLGVVEFENGVKALGLIEADNPKIGMKVWLKEMEMAGEIIEILGKNVKVDMDGIFLNTTSDRLYQITEKKIKQINKQQKISVPKHDAKMELKILGYRFEEALPEIETFLDDAVVNGLLMVRIVHGKGTGALRAKVRNYLKTNRNTEEFFSPPPEAGGSGVTVIKIKE